MKVSINETMLPKLVELGESELKVFLAISLMCDRSTILINKEFILALMGRLNYTEGTVRNCVSLLGKKNVLIKSPSKRGVYSINKDIGNVVVKGDKARLVTENELDLFVDYEVRSSWWASLISWDWAQELSSLYFAWKVKRKYNRYKKSKRIEKLLKESI